MTLRVVSSKLASRVSQRPVQKRTFLDWMTNYPDRVRTTGAAVGAVVPGDCLFDAISRQGTLKDLYGIFRWKS